MSLFDKFASLTAGYRRLEGRKVNPFNIAFDVILSPTEAMLKDQHILLLGTNNYLGLTHDPVVMGHAIEAIQRFGTGTTGSRIANGSYACHMELEHALADFYGRKYAMVFSTGYQANLGILSTIAGKNDHLVLDADSHASLYDGSRLGHAQVTRFRHNDPDDLARRLRRLSGVPGDKVVVVEGIYSMLGDTAPLRELVQVKREWGAYLVVDEAHSLGVLGATGRGLAEADGVEADADFIVGTFSKSLAGVGGFCEVVDDHRDVVEQREAEFAAAIEHLVEQAAVAVGRNGRPQNLHIGHGLDQALRVTRRAVEIDNDRVVRVVGRNRDGRARDNPVIGTD